MWASRHRHDSCINFGEADPVPPSTEVSIRTFLVSLIGVTAVAAGILVVRSQKDAETGSEKTLEVPPGETVPARIVLERIREAGI